MSAKKKTTLGDVGVVALCVLLFGGLLGMPLWCHLLREKDPKLSRVEELLGALTRGDYTKAYSCTEQVFQAKVTPGRFRAVLEAIPFSQAENLRVRFKKFFGNRSAMAEALFDHERGTASLTFYIYRSITGSDYLIGQILVGDRRLFAEELGDW